MIVIVVFDVFWFTIGPGCLCHTPLSWIFFVPFLAVVSALCMFLLVIIGTMIQYWCGYVMFCFQIESYTVDATTVAVEQSTEESAEQSVEQSIEESSEEYSEQSVEEMTEESVELATIQRV